MSKKLKATLTDAFKAYENKYGLTSDQYQLIASTVNHLIIADIVENGSAYVLPYGTGLLSIIKSKAKVNPHPDFKLLNEEGIALPHRNLHSDGKYAMFKWWQNHPFAFFRTKGMWRYKSYRENKKLLSRAIINRNTITKYLESS